MIIWIELLITYINRSLGFVSSFGIAVSAYGITKEEFRRQRLTIKEKGLVFGALRQAGVSLDQFAKFTRFRHSSVYNIHNLTYQDFDSVHSPPNLKDLQDAERKFPHIANTEDFKTLHSLKHRTGFWRWKKEGNAVAHPDMPHQDPDLVRETYDDMAEELNRSCTDTRVWYWFRTKVNW